MARERTPRTMEDVDAIRRYLFAGAATVTLTSGRTGQSYTYQVDSPPDHQGNFDGFYVRLLTGPNNTSDYTYMGIIRGRDYFKLTQKSRLKANSPPVRAFDWFMRQVVVNGTSPKIIDLQVRHEGACGRCGRALTVPESIDRGIGPECWGRMHHA